MSTALGSLCKNLLWINQTVLEDMLLWTWTQVTNKTQNLELLLDADDVAKVLAMEDFNIMHVCSYSDFGGSAPAAKPPKSEVLRTMRKNSKIGGFVPTVKTPKSEVLRSLKNISNNI